MRQNHILRSKKSLAVYEYDEQGRVLHFSSEGMCDWYGDELEQVTLLNIDFVYNNDGKLKERYYQHNSFLFGTGYTLWACYFDESERIEYEYIYITHGHIENYYIYSEDSEKPQFVLNLDCNMGIWMPVFTKY